MPYVDHSLIIAGTRPIDAQKCTPIPAVDPLIEGLTAPALGGPARPCVMNRIAPAATLAIPTPPITSPAIALVRAELALAPSRVGVRLARAAAAYGAEQGGEDNVTVVVVRYL